MTQTGAVSATATPTATTTVTATVTSTTTLTSGATATPTAIATATPTVTGGAVNIEIGTAVGQPGSTVGFAVTFVFTNRFQIVAISHCIAINPDAPFARTATNEPDCTVNPALQKPDSTFTFEPNGCDPAVDCQSMCADIHGPEGSPVISMGAMLYSCRIAIPGATPDGTYPLACAGPSHATTSQGMRVDGVVCGDGQVIVETRLPGDCNGDGSVTIDELITGVNIALDLRPVTACPAFDTNAEGQVTIEDLVAAVNAALTT